MDAFPSLAGQALIAMPSIGDARFARSVIYICVHDADGAMGVVVNKPDSKRVVSNVLDELDLETHADPDEALEARLGQRVLRGGPVETTRGFVLHGPDVPVCEGTIAVTSSVSLSTRLEVLRDIAQGKGPEQFLLALGFAGWDAGQLDQEILQNAWLHGSLEGPELFTIPPELHYAASLSGLGVDVNKLSPVAGRG